MAGEGPWAISRLRAEPPARAGKSAIGFGGTEDESSEGESSSDTTGSDTTDATTDDTLPEPLATVMGLTADMDGTILTGPGIQLCGPIDVDGNVESCLPAKLSDGGDGSFSVGAPKLGLYALKVEIGRASCRERVSSPV